MLSTINTSREVIKNRMLKHALTYWGVKNTEDLDPAVKLILEALSLELYNLGNEIKDTQVRILEKIADLLAPDFLTSPNPAHAILHASPIEAVEVLSTTTAFYTQRKVSTRQNEVLDALIDVYFTPVDHVRLLDVQPMYLSTGGNLYNYDSSFNKQLVSRNPARNTVNNIIWLGLKVHPEITTLDGLTFCFDWKNLETRLAHKLYQLLPLAKWYIGENEISTLPGLRYAAVEQETDVYEDIFLNYDLLSLLEKDIKSYYDQKFVSLETGGSENIHDLKETYPASFIDMFPGGDLQKMKEKLIWVKIMFPAAMLQEYLDEVYLYPNAFPVLNRQVNDLKYRLKGGSNIVPLKTGAFDQFLSVKTLSDEFRTYKSVPYRRMNEEETGTYTLRKGGVERFDGRDAREMISYLLELLRSESAAFAAYGYDFIASTLKEMNQKISLMEQKTKGYVNNAAEIPNYIIVKPFDANDTMYAEYWTTLAELGNNLRAGTKMQLGKGVKVKQDTVVFMTTTTGGKNRLRPEERLNAFRYGIMTRNRVITKEDIRNFCFYELGDTVTSIDISRGFEMSADAKQSFTRTVDVVLTPARSEILKQDEWELVAAQLKAKLQLRSGLSNNYRIIVSGNR